MDNLAKEAVCFHAARDLSRGCWSSAGDDGLDNSGGGSKPSAGHAIPFTRLDVHKRFVAPNFPYRIWYTCVRRTLAMTSSSHYSPPPPRKIDTKRRGGEGEWTIHHSLFQQQNPDYNYRTIATSTSLFLSQTRSIKFYLSIPPYLTPSSLFRWIVCLQGKHTGLHSLLLAQLCLHLISYNM